MEEKDIRWIQRFENFRNALGRLSYAINYLKSETELDENLKEMLMTGAVKKFELAWELAWKVMKDYAEYEGYRDIRGSRDAFRKAFSMGLINDERWMQSIDVRNMTSHDYDEGILNSVYESISSIYYPLFKDFEKKMLSFTEPELPLSCHTD